MIDENCPFDIQNFFNTIFLTLKDNGFFITHNNNNCEYLQNDFVLIDTIVYAERLSDNTPLTENLYRKK